MREDPVLLPRPEQPVVASQRQRPDPRELLRGVELKVTAGRLAVLDSLAARPHLTAEQIFRRIVPAVPTTSIQSVHNILHDFVRAGLVRRIEPAGSPARYDLRVGDNHHHLVCSVCGRIEDVDCVVGRAPCLQLSDDLGFDVSEAEITFWGICPNCSAPNRKTPKDTDHD